MNDRYWKEKYADYHSRSESRIAELEKENAELKKAVETLAKGLCIRRIAELEKENAELKKAVETLAKGLCIRQNKLEELLE